jgi:hypothetical protein
MEQKKSEFNKVLNAWDVLVIAFGAMIGWGWVVSTGGWIEKGREEWAHVVKNAMLCDYSWESSAVQYIALYEKLKEN